MSAAAKRGFQIAVRSWSSATSAIASGGPSGYQLSAVHSPFRPKVKDVVRAFDHVQIMLDDNHGVAQLD